MLTNFEDRTLTLLLFAILVKRLGGKAIITQADIDDVAYSTLHETSTDFGITFTLGERSKAS